MDNILSVNDFILDDFNPAYIAEKIAGNLRERRLELNLTQKALSDKSGVSLGTLKRFENKHEISLKHLLMLAVVLDATGEFMQLFTKRNYTSIDDVINAQTTKKRKRGSRNV
ncbi:MAG: helix-turn-helix transcriptional regulator [Prolixibacteraceae bacterium]|jgi:transcriptional regulator with XRE-family HTH domain|nr:helix-turn-helix transcriptional regulator [Prolixibacteraceae bacterium]